MRRSFAMLILLMAAATGYSQAPYPPAPVVADAYAPIVVEHEPNANGHTEELDAEDHLEEEIERPERFWFRGEYLLWWVDDPNFPVLATTGPTTSAAPGALGDPFTALRFGGEVETHERSGGRFSFGWWLDDCQCAGLEFNYFFLGERSILLNLTSPGAPVLARPFLNAVTRESDSQLITFPGLASGDLQIESPLSLDGFEFNFIKSLNGSADYPIRGILGLRYVNLDEALLIHESSMLLPKTARFAGRTIRISDEFSTGNAFFGGQVGLTASYRIRRLEIELGTKVAFGVMNQEVDIRGRTHLDSAPAVDVPAGFLAVASNSGGYTRNVFTAVPEGNVNIHFQVTHRLRTTVGFQFLYLGRVVRPGDQVDLRVNPALVPTSTTFGAGGPGLPSFIGQDTEFWAYGLSLGLQFKF